MSAEAAVLNKVFEILRRELSTEEYLTYLRMVTPRIGDATKELREKTKDLCLDEVIEGVREIEKGTIKMRAKIIALSNSGGGDRKYYKEITVKENCWIVELN